MIKKTYIKPKPIPPGEYTGTLVTNKQAFKTTKGEYKGKLVLGIKINGI